MSKREKKPAPTYELVRELFDYRDGMLFWRVDRSSGVKAGDRAGCLHKKCGYRRICIKKRIFEEHRIIYLWHHGYWTENQVDHINRCRDDNRIENLREVSHSCNVRNTGIAINNKSGVTGVSFERNGSRWRVGIGKGYGSRDKLVGRYKDFIDAVIARWNAEVEHNYPGCNSTSSAYQYLLKSGEVFFDGNGQAIKRISEAC